MGIKAYNIIEISLTVTTSNFLEHSLYFYQSIKKLQPFRRKL